MWMVMIMLMIGIMTTDTVHKGAFMPNLVQLGKELIKLANTDSQELQETTHMKS